MEYRRKMCYLAPRPSVTARHGPNWVREPHGAAVRWFRPAKPFTQSDEGRLHER